MVDEFVKHKDFCFTSQEPNVSSDEIRNIRKQIHKTTGKKIDYEDPLFQLLKRFKLVFILILCSRRI